MMKLLVVLLSACTVAYGFVPHLDGRIVGGEAVEIEQFPYQVSLRVYDQHICGGALLDASTVLTAAHCVHGMDASRYSVRAGASKHGAGVAARVAHITVHSKYTPSRYDNDVAVVKLSTPLRLGSRVQPVPLQTAEVAPGTGAWVSGWGVTSEGSHQVPVALRAVHVDVISSEACSRSYGQGKITEHMICAQTRGKDSCQGDSGGPLVAAGKLIGVVSWGYGCARPQYPGVYAKVSDLHSWIMANK